MTGGPAPLLSARGVVKLFHLPGALGRRGPRVIRAVDGADLDVGEGETVGLVGESGCGKTTLGRCLLLLTEPDAGRIVLRGQDTAGFDRGQTRAARRTVQAVFQDPLASLNPRHRIGGIIAEPLAIHRIGTVRERQERVAELLALTGLPPDAGGRYPHELSGGQRQRACIARALAVQPALIIADEPLSALDVSLQARIMNLFQDLQDRFGLAYVFISHDLAAVRFLSQRVAVMYAGRIVETGPTASVFSAPRHPYTQALIQAVPTGVPSRRRPAALAGEPPSPSAWPPGCRFHPRCPLARPQICGSTSPELTEREPGTAVACHFA